MKLLTKDGMVWRRSRESETDGWTHNLHTGGRRQCEDGRTGDDECEEKNWWVLAGRLIRPRSDKACMQSVTENKTRFVRDENCKFIKRLNTQAIEKSIEIGNKKAYL